MLQLGHYYIICIEKTAWKALSSSSKMETSIYCIISNTISLYRKRVEFWYCCGWIQNDCIHTIHNMQCLFSIGKTRGFWVSSVGQVSLWVWILLLCTYTNTTSISYTLIFVPWGTENFSLSVSRGHIHELLNTNHIIWTSVMTTLLILRLLFEVKHYELEVISFSHVLSNFDF